MKTVDEVANQQYPYNEDEYSWVTERDRNSFKTGIEFAQRWISVKDELPEKGKMVLIINNFGFEGVGCYDGKIWKFYSIDVLTNSFNIKECVVGGFTNITHWRLIDLK